MGVERYIADRTKEIRLSGTLRYNDRVREMRLAGINVIDFASMPDTPRHVKDAARDMLYSSEAASYTDIRGLPELRKIVAQKLENENGIAADPDRQIIITHGGHSAVLTSLLALVNLGDEVLIEDPLWVTYVPSVRLAGGKPIFVPLIEKARWKLTGEEIERRVTQRTKILVMCNPHNPSGVVRGRDDVEEIVDVAKKHDLLVISDECYEKYVYDGLRHYSIASFPDMADRTITIQTTSKIFNMFGWRVGWVTGRKEIIEQMLKIHSHMLGSATSFAQAGALAALKNEPLLVMGDLTLQEFIARWQKKRDAMIDGLNTIPGVSCVKGSGGFFTFPNFSLFGKPSMELHELLLEKAKILTTPGIEFGPTGEGHLRFLYSSSLAEIEEGLDRLRTTLADLSLVPSIRK